MAGTSVRGAAASVSSAPRVGANYPLDSTKPKARGDEAPGLAADPADRNHVVEVDQDVLAGQCEYHVSFDGGQNWTGGNLSAPSGFPDPPCVGLSGAGYPHMEQSVAFGSGQNVYTVFDSRQSASVPDSVLVAHSPDGGRTFATAVVAVAGTPAGPDQYVRAQLAVMPRSNGDVVYVSSWAVLFPSEATGKIVVAHSIDGGATWSAAIPASAPGVNAIEPTQPVVSPDGSVHVGWRTQDASGASHELQAANSTDGGMTWSQVKVGPVTGARRTDPKMAVDSRNGTLYVAYQYGSLQGETQGPDFGSPDIYVQRSTDAGRTWSSPARVNDDPAGQGTDHRSPHLSVAPDGRLDVVWYDRRNAHSPARKECAVSLTRPGFGDVYYASSTDGGVTFSANRRITDRLIDWDVGFDCRVADSNLLGPVSAALGNNGVLFAWPDSRQGNVGNENQDVYLARMTTAPLAVTSVRHSSSVAIADALSQLAFPGGAEATGQSALPFGATAAVGGVTKVVVVNQGDPAAALAGAVLARAVSGPLLLTPAAGLPGEVSKEVARLHPSAAYVIGGTGTVSSTVISQLQLAGITGTINRLAGSDPADIARLVAQAVAGETHIQSDIDRPAHTAVVVDATSSVAPAASALAAGLRLPLLYVDRTQVPAATAQAISSLGITDTMVVAESGWLSQGALGGLPSPRLISGIGTTATERAVETVDWGTLPHNVVYAVQPSQPVVAAVVAAASARLGGEMIVASGSTQADDVIASVGTLAAVDRVVVVSQPGRSWGRWLALVLAALFCLLGGAFFLLAWRRTRTGELGV